MAILDQSVIQGSLIAMNTMAHSQTLAPVISAIRGHGKRIHDLGVTELFVFGSRARGDNRTDSDLDILVDFDPEKLSLFDLIGVHHIIEDATGLETHVTTRSSFRKTGNTRYEQHLIQVL
jgi:uncharacterized protein